MCRQAQSPVGGRIRREKKVRAPLTPGELLELDQALVRAFQTIRELRHKYHAAKHIKFPALPSVYSESLVIALANRLFGPEWKARYGGSQCDVLIQNHEGETRRVEVKATGEHAFQEFKGKDLVADFLVWVRFGTRFQTGNGPIEIVVLEQPGRYIAHVCRLDKARFEKLVRTSTALRTIPFNSLQELLAQVSST